MFDGIIQVMLWRDVNAIYQIYPRSFRDDSGDGIGDLKGITQKLDYIKGGEESVGVDAIWISPFYASPMHDFGYDVSNYRSVDPMFGTLEDFDDLIKAAHERDIKVMMDIVPNHTSSEHPWFKEALANPHSDKRDYYLFRDGKTSGTPPNNWLSVFGGPGWERDEATGQYYMHSFLKEQPDLNWENPQVQNEMADILRFWFDRGVDGFRVDAIRWMGKDLLLRDDPVNPAYTPGVDDPYHSVIHEHSMYGSQLDRYLGHIASVASEYTDRIILWEDHLDKITPLDAQIKRIYAVRPDVSAPFNFQLMHTPYGARSFAKTVDEYLASVPPNGRLFYCLSNHDESRLVTRYGKQQARMLAVLQLMLPGTPVMYYGQEIGMEDAVIPPERLRDPFELRVPGKGLGRDPERTPMQWSAAQNAGFSEANDTWLPVAANYQHVNVAAQANDPASPLALHKRLLALRDAYPVINSDNYKTLYVDDDVYVFWRTDGDVGFLVALNFSDSNAKVHIPDGGTFELSAQNHAYQTYDYIAPYDGLVIRYEKPSTP